MAVDSPANVIASLLEKLRIDDPFVQPRSWDSVPSQGGASSQPPSRASPYATPTLSEPSLVRLAMNALQGLESALMSVEKISALLRYSSADRTSHRIPSLWTRCSSTSSVGNLLTSLGQFGCIVFLLRRFVNYFTTPDFSSVRELEVNKKSDSCEEGKSSTHKQTLINQAFAISVGKVIDGYISALNTLSASVSLRRFSKMNVGGCLTSIGHLEVTLVELYLHTAELRTQIEALGNICNINHLTVNFPLSSLEELKTKANSEFGAFPRSGALLSFLYSQLKVADPDHSALLKFLFLQSYEPYSDFIRSWIYDGSISDPYCEFVVECVEEISVYASDDMGFGCGSALPSVRVRNGVAVPCFLEECLIPLCRTGQQLQVIMKLLELCNFIGACGTHEEILPSMVGLSHDYPWFAFPLTFNKETIEAMVLVRTSYYVSMIEKIEGILTRFDFSYQQATTESVSLRLVNNLGKNVIHEASSVADESLVSSPTDERNQTHGDSEGSSIVDEDSYAEDFLDSSECSSSGRSEEQDEAEKLILAAPDIEASYLSALDFSSSLSTSSTMQNIHEKEFSCSLDDVPLRTDEKFGHETPPSCKVTNLVGCEDYLSQDPATADASSEDDFCLFGGDHIDGRRDDTWSLSPHCRLDLMMRICELPSTDLDPHRNSSKVNASNTDLHQHITGGSLTTSSFHAWKLKYDPTLLSMNPTLNRGSFCNLRTVLRERHNMSYMGSHFDFNNVKDPLKEYAVQLAGRHGPEFENERSVIDEAPAAQTDTDKHLGSTDYNDVITVKKAKLCIGLPPNTKDNCEEHLSIPVLSGGSAWESTLGRSVNLVNKSAGDYRTRLVGGAEMPLDFVIKKCLVDEILLQYTYISKLTIKLLIEGFKLREHLHALRCYHFMELADWADLFIMSLWSHKWLVNEVDKRIPEIQGVLELSVQRSSCERDPNKDRLYVYLKGDCVTHLSAPAKGIHSFDFLGLGYRVDWPVSIILTPAALQIYSKIFNFLIQVKLAVFSLSDAWCSLKFYRLEQHKGEVHQVSILTETRHKVNHFVSMLQQYVQSQLSQVSWYRFLHSLEHKVNDMLDLESVHMAYLSESLHICFLSNETQSIAGIIQNILQCAMDFRSCLTGTILSAGSIDENLSCRLSQIDISQVQSIRSAFTKNLEELYLIYLQSPKHGDFGISHFWDYLNYNEYYRGVMSNQMGHHVFY